MQYHTLILVFLKSLRYDYTRNKNKNKMIVSYIKKIKYKYNKKNKFSKKPTIKIKK